MSTTFVSSEVQLNSEDLKRMMDAIAVICPMDHPMPGNPTGIDGYKAMFLMAQVSTVLFSTVGDESIMERWMAAVAENVAEVRASGNIVTQQYEVGSA